MILLIDILILLTHVIFSSYLGMHADLLHHYILDCTISTFLKNIPSRSLEYNATEVTTLDDQNNHLFLQCSLSVYFFTPT